MNKIWFYKYAEKFGLAFQDPKVEDMYQQSRIQGEKYFLMIIHITLCIFSISLAISYSIDGPLLAHKLFRVIICIFTLSLWFLRKNFNVYECLVSMVHITYTLYFCFKLEEVMIDDNSNIWATGFGLGYFQAIIIISSRRIRIKLACQTTLFIAMGTRSGIYPMIIIGSVVMMLWTIRDIIERKNFAIAYENNESLQKFKDLVSVDFPVKVAIIDRQMKNILYSNKIFEEKFSIQEKSISAVFENFVLRAMISNHGSSSNFTDCNFDKVLNSLSEGKIPLKDEDVFECTATKIISQKPQTFQTKIRKITWEKKLCYALLMNDISDKEYITALKKADEYKDKIMASVSHELRTPINGVLGMLNIISDSVKDQHIQKYIDDCKNCGRLLLYFVNSILDLNQIKSETLTLNKSYFSIGEIVSELYSIYHFQAETKNIEFIIYTPKDLPKFIYTDKYRLLQILINLVTNAFKFTQKGKVEVIIETGKENQNALKFSVRDTGIGIEAHHLENLFQRFRKLPQDDKKLNSEGVGLGLAISQELIRWLGPPELKFINVESTPGQGTTFSFFTLIEEEKNSSSIQMCPTSTYMVIPNELHEIEQTESPENSMVRLFEHKLNNCTNLGQVDEINTAITLKKKIPKVLVVDDNPFNLKAISYSLTKINAEVYTALSGHEAINFMLKNSVDLILMDIQMPILDGFETTRIILNHVYSGKIAPVRIVALTANGKSAKEEALNCGMHGCYQKPIKDEALKELLKDFF